MPRRRDQPDPSQYYSLDRKSSTPRWIIDLFKPGRRSNKAQVVITWDVPPVVNWEVTHVETARGLTRTKEKAVGVWVTLPSKPTSAPRGTVPDKATGSSNTRKESKPSRVRARDPEEAASERSRKRRKLQDDTALDVVEPFPPREVKERKRMPRTVKGGRA